MLTYHNFFSTYSSNIWGLFDLFVGDIPSSKYGDNKDDCNENRVNIDSGISILNNHEVLIVYIMYLLVLNLN